MSQYWATRVEEAVAANPDFDATRFELPEGYLSASSLFLYWACPKAFYYRYVLGVVSGKSAALASGSAVHRALELAFLTKLETDTTMPKEAFEAAFSDAFDKQSEGVGDWGGLKPEAIKDQGIVLLGLYYDKIMPLVKPRAVELEFVKFVDNAVPVVGRIDLIDEGLPQFRGVEPDPNAAINPAPDVEIVDFKTSAKKWGAAKVENDFQITLYAHFEGIPRTRFDLLVKTKTPYIYQARAIRSAGDGRWAAKLVLDVADGVSRGYFPCCAPDGWSCREGKCAAWDRCRGAR